MLMKHRSTNRFENEIEHGKLLASGRAEEIWGWGTPAGRRRAQRRAGLIMKDTGIGGSSRILEIGCGTGLFTEMFAMSGAEMVALDLSPELLSVARNRNIPRVQFLEASFEDSSLDGPFDAVIGSSVLHHLDMDRALPRIYSLLKPGGIFSFAEPNMLNPQVYCERHFRAFFPQTSPDETAFVRFRLKRDLEQCGFHGVSIVPFDWLHPATPPRFIGAVLQIGRVLEGVWPLKEFAGSLSIRAQRSL
jgi:SAM-dependent methyltransferase